jgi:hypothetical protein
LEAVKAVIVREPKARGVGCGKFWEVADGALEDRFGASVVADAWMDVELGGRGE